MDASLMNQLHRWKENLEPEGILLLGIFGSRARGDFHIDSDIDILYEWTPEFLQKHPGWSACGRLEEIREQMGEQLGLKVDLANRKTLHRLGEQTILPEVVHV